MRLIKYYLVVISLLCAAPKYAISQVLPSDSTSVIDASILSDFKIIPHFIESRVAIDVYIKHPERVAAMSIDRSAGDRDVYTTIIEVTVEELKNIKNHVLTLIDKNPLPSIQPVYYRLMIEDKEGVIRYYPPATLVKTSTAP